MSQSGGVLLGNALGNARSSSSRRKALRALTVSVAILAVSLTFAEAPAATTCASPPAVFPESSITPGMAGTGLTAVQGSAPVSFDIQVIGILPNALLPGFDLVIFKITGPQAFLDQAHGVASGMSGSPIYIGGQLAGAVSYSFGLAADPMVGLFTPAQQMVDLTALPTGSATSLPSSVAVTPQVRVAVADAAKVPVNSVPTTVQRLAIPLGVSGLSDQRAQRLQSIIDNHGLPFHVYRAGGAASASAATINPMPLAAGEPLAAELSNGDVTFAGIGTATFACGDLNVGWGHSFFFQGPSSFAMGGASVITIVNDVSGLFGPFKILVPTDLRGTVVQDRLAGLMGQVGTVPTAMPVTTTFTNNDDGKTRTGRTDIFYQQDFWGPEIVYEHVFQNLLLVFDHFGKGTLSLSYTIQGLRQDGVTPFTVHNSNMVASGYDAFRAANRLLTALYRLEFNRAEEVTFTSVEASGEITDQQLVGEIVRVRTSSSLQRALRDRPVLRAKRGSRITLEVMLRPAGGGPPETATLRMRVPHRADGFELISFRGGRARQRIDRHLGFKQLVTILNGGEHPNDLIASGLGRRLVQKQDVVVDGQAAVTVKVVG
ncbi:MAG TPA: SpoIVB peptidase S55 domain-containing protein [Actinomycetota bacterium]